MKTLIRLCLGFLMLIGCATPIQAQDSAFSGERAMHWLQYQCDLGPRTPQSPGHGTLRRTIRSLADSLGFKAAELCFTIKDPYADKDLTLCNIIVTVGPEDSRHLWLGAHYDSRPFCDRDADPVKAKQPLIGANDAGSGTAVLLHLMEIFAENPPSRRIQLIFFDGEDYGRAGDLAGFCLGSKHLAEGLRSFGSPLLPELVDGLIVLDMVAERDAFIQMENTSLRYAPDWTRAVFQRAVDLGLAVFDMSPGPSVYDDHVPFLQMGIPSLDLIDFDYPQWHTSDDSPRHCSPQSLEAVGSLVLDIAYRPLD